MNTDYLGKDINSSRDLNHAMEEIKEALEDYTIDSISQVATGIRDLRQMLAVDADVELARLSDLVQELLEALIDLRDDYELYVGKHTPKADAAIAKCML